MLNLLINARTQVYEYLLHHFFQVRNNEGQLECDPVWENQISNTFYSYPTMLMAEIHEMTEEKIKDPVKAAATTTHTLLKIMDRNFRNDLFPELKNLNDLLWSPENLLPKTVIKTASWSNFRDMNTNARFFIQTLCYIQFLIGLHQHLDNTEEYMTTGALREVKMLNFYSREWFNQQCNNLSKFTNNMDDIAKNRAYWNIAKNTLGPQHPEKRLLPTLVVLSPIPRVAHPLENVESAPPIVPSFLQIAEQGHNNANNSVNNNLNNGDPSNTTMNSSGQYVSGRMEPS